jgi:hypothetical protein
MDMKEIGLEVVDWFQYGQVAADLLISVLIHCVQSDNFESIVMYVFRMHKLKHIGS